MTTTVSGRLLQEKGRERGETKHSAGLQLYSEWRMAEQGDRIGIGNERDTDRLWEGMLSSEREEGIGGKEEEGQGKEK